MGFALPLNEMTTTEKLRMMEQIGENLCRSRGVSFTGMACANPQ